MSEDDTRKVLRCNQRDIANFIHVQMQAHYWEEAEGVEVKISKGFTDLKPSAYSAAARRRRVQARERAVSDLLQVRSRSPRIPARLRGGNGGRHLHAGAEVLAKKAVAEKWCEHASDHAKTYGGKPWQYALIPHDLIADNMTLGGLAPPTTG